MRLEIARSRGVPPYVIFHDSTLRELARAQAAVAALSWPASTAWARARSKRFGGVVLETINAHG